MTTPDHVENTGDNLRHAAEVTNQSGHDEEETRMSPEDVTAAKPLPDFNT